MLFFVGCCGPGLRPVFPCLILFVVLFWGVICCLVWLPYLPFILDIYRLSFYFTAHHNWLGKRHSYPLYLHKITQL